MVRIKKIQFLHYHFQALFPSSVLISESIGNLTLRYLSVEVVMATFNYIHK